MQRKYLEFRETYDRWEKNAKYNIKSENTNEYILSILKNRPIGIDKELEGKVYVVKDYVIAN